MKNRLTLLAVALSVVTLTACNDSDQALTVTPREDSASNDSGALALRSMTTDIGNSISSPDAVDVPDAEKVDNLIDGNYNSKFLTFSANATMLFSATSPYLIKGYALVSADDQPKRDPALWTLEASNDGDNWIELDSQNNQTFAKRGARNSYPLSDNDIAYQHYRLSATHVGTDDFGGNILQLAEFELMVKADKPLVSFISNKARAQVNEKVFFLDQSLANPTQWQWTFADGTPAQSNAQHPTVTFSTIGPKTVTLEASNDKGSNVLTKQHTLWVWNPAEPWAGFVQPQVNLVKNDAQHLGQLALEQAIPDLPQLIHQVSLGVAKILYHDVTQIQRFDTVTFETGHYDYPAAKGGSATDMILTMDLDHIHNVAANGEQALRDEVIGMLWHELTHGYSASPQSGQYASGDEYHTFLEALADFVRIKAGFNEHKRAGIKWVKDWNSDAYNQTSFFLEWVVNAHHSIDFIKQFNQQAKTLPQWSFDLAFKAILGQDRGIQILWDQYQTEYLAKILGLTPPYPTPVTGYRNFAIDEGVSIVTNATDITVWGEGVAQLIDNNINVKFNGVIEQPWWLAQYLPQLQPINQIDNVVITIEVPQATVLDKYSLTTANDNDVRDPSAWTVSGSQDGEHWIDLDSAAYPISPERLTTFHYDVDDNTSAYRYFQFNFANQQQGDGVGGDDGRLVQIGELALLSEL